MLVFDYKDQKKVVKRCGVSDVVKMGGGGEFLKLFSYCTSSPQKECILQTLGNLGLTVQVVRVSHATILYLLTSQNLLSPFYLPGACTFIEFWPTKSYVNQEAFTKDFSRVILALTTWCEICRTRQTVFIRFDSIIFLQ